MDSNWYQHSFLAMGCHMTVWLAVESEMQAEQAFGMVEDAFENAEQRMSRFRVDSELAWLNAQADQWCQPSPPMWHVIVKAFQLMDETDGLFDPTLHDALVAAGYNQTFDNLNGVTPSPTAAAVQAVRQAIQLDLEQQAIRLPQGVRIDLGGIGKGFTAQTVVEWLNEWGPCLISAGGDVTAGDAPDGMPGWPVGVGAPWERENPEQANVMRLWLANGSLATSGIDYRKWQRGDGMAHHIIDPRTGISAETDILTCSVVAADACRAEAWATATLVAGAQTGHETLIDHNFAGAIINHQNELWLTPTMRMIAQLEQDIDLSLI